jgi:hypothetical protein
MRPKSGCNPFALLCCFGGFLTLGPHGSYSGALADAGARTPRRIKQSPRPVPPYRPGIFLPDSALALTNEYSRRIFNGTAFMMQRSLAFSKARSDLHAKVSTRPIDRRAERPLRDSQLRQLAVTAGCWSVCCCGALSPCCGAFPSCNNNFRSLVRSSNSMSTISNDAACGVALRMTA